MNAMHDLTDEPVKELRQLLGQDPDLWMEPVRLRNWLYDRCPDRPLEIYLLFEACRVGVAAALQGVDPSVAEFRAPVQAEQLRRLRGVATPAAQWAIGAWFYGLTGAVLPDDVWTRPRILSFVARLPPVTAPPSGASTSAPRDANEPTAHELSRGNTVEVSWEIAGKPSSIKLFPNDEDVASVTGSRLVAIPDQALQNGAARVRLVAYDEDGNVADEKVLDIYTPRVQIRSLQIDTEFAPTPIAEVYWQVEGARSVRLLPKVGLVGPEGTLRLPLTSNTTRFTLYAEGEYETKQEAVTVRLPHVVDLRFSQTTADASGGYTLAWETHGADDVRLDGRPVPASASAHRMETAGAEVEHNLAVYKDGCTADERVLKARACRVTRFETSQSRVLLGTPVRLEWDTEHARRVWLEDMGRRRDVTGETSTTVHVKNLRHEVRIVAAGPVNRDVHTVQIYGVAPPSLGELFRDQREMDLSVPTVDLDFEKLRQVDLSLVEAVSTKFPLLRTAAQEQTGVANGKGRTMKEIALGDHITDPRVVDQLRTGITLPTETHCCTVNTPDLHSIVDGITAKRSHDNGSSSGVHRLSTWLRGLWQRASQLLPPSVLPTTRGETQ
jgi:hypothetical protein